MKTPNRQGIPSKPSVLNHVGKQDHSYEPSQLRRPQIVAQPPKEPEITSPQIEAIPLVTSTPYKQPQVSSPAAPKGPLHQAPPEPMSPRMSSQPALILDDSASNVSPLHCGSIVPDPHYNPAADQSHLPFVPPLEIYIRVKVEVPEWLQSDVKRPSFNRGHSAPEARVSSSSIPASIGRQVSWESQCYVPNPNTLPPPEFTGIDVVPLSPRLSPRKPGKTYRGQVPTRTESRESAETCLTIPIDFSSDDDDDQKEERPMLTVVPERRMLPMRALTAKLPSFRKPIEEADFVAPQGCMA
eukprot:Nitzschia sp. Nitz4//scaffold36_size144017//134717//135610//NITZ4_003118-RA/size144017-exonerate_est2genome-gene-0.170-mRNA-1//1//CDS//3329549552//1459//frame0